MLNVKKILYSMLVSLILLSSCKNIQNSENDSHLNSRLDSKPVVTNFSDSGGNNVLSGKSLINTNEIQISWDSVKADNVVYQVIIRNSLSAKWLASVKSNYVIIPVNSLEPGTYYLTINAQNIYGDVLFETYNYYSVSNCSSASISFCIE